MFHWFKNNRNEVWTATLYDKRKKMIQFLADGFISFQAQRM